jgi:hypothetical protein
MSRPAFQDSRVQGGGGGGDDDALEEVRDELRRAALLRRFPFARSLLSGLFGGLSASEASIRLNAPSLTVGRRRRQHRRRRRPETLKGKNPPPPPPPPRNMRHGPLLSLPPPCQVVSLPLSFFCEEDNMDREAPGAAPTSSSSAADRTYADICRDSADGGHRRRGKSCLAHHRTYIWLSPADGRTGGARKEDGEHPQLRRRRHCLGHLGFRPGCWLSPMFEGDAAAQRSRRAASTAAPYVFFFSNGGVAGRTNGRPTLRQSRDRGWGRAGAGVRSRTRSLPHPSTSPRRRRR